MSRTIFVLNPKAGGGRAISVRDRLWARRPELRGFFWIDSDDPGESADRLRAAIEKGDVDRVIAVGGDGTAHGVAGLLLESGSADKVGFGLVPAGTGSDFVRYLGLPKAPEKTLDHLLKAEPRRIDAIRVDTDGGARAFCLNIASAGLSGAVDQEVNASAKRGSYLWASLKVVLRYRPLPCKVWADGQPVFDGRFFVVAIANGRFFGNGMKVAPEAQIDDGLLDVVLVPPIAKWQLPLRMPQFLAGQHVGLKTVISLQAREVRLEPAEGFFPFDLDGETLEAEPATFRILPKALRLLA